jgi:beta-lactamase superfamily II metal-dependent hydrolase
MPNSHLVPPASDELEVSLFGPGYGEAIVLHIGEGKWILVDSCIEPNSKLPASLEYLYNLNVDVENAVKLVVATHWHDDHVRGISTIFDNCKSANIAISSALKVDEFRKLATLSSGQTVRRNSGLDEFTRVFQLLETRKQHRVRFNSPKLASADKLLYRDQIGPISETVEAKVFSLSPSDAAILHAQLAFAELLPGEDSQRKRVASPTPNYASVVLWVQVGNHKILLGADLERTVDPKTGWSVILNDSTVVVGQAGVFKIPHHGSENAHHECVWSELVSEKPFAIVSPFCKGGMSLPSPADVKRITHLTPHAYATASAKRRQQKWHDRVVRSFVEEMTRSIQSVHYGWGHVRLRNKIDENNQSWRVELFGDAHALNT